MAEKEIVILNELLNGLNQKKFDLEAWKNHTVLFLERVFGPESSKVKMIKELHYDYSSWNLRDVAGAGKAKDPVKMRASEIINAIISELQQLGLPQEIIDHEKTWNLLKEELTGKQVKEIKSLINSQNSDKTEKIQKILENIEKESLCSIIAELLIS